MGADNVYPAGADNGVDVQVIEQRIVGVSFDDANSGLLVNAAKFLHDGSDFQPQRTHWGQITANVDGTATGVTVDMSTSPMSKFALFLRRAAETVAPSVDLEVTIEAGSIFTPIITQTNINIATFQVDRPALSMRFVVTDFGTGDDMTISILALP